jgi:hypothetical protein
MARESTNASVRSSIQLIAFCFVSDHPPRPVFSTEADVMGGDLQGRFRAVGAERKREFLEDDHGMIALDRWCGQP